MNLFRLDGKVAIVTGASRGLGLAMARGLAQAGAHVVLVARGEDALGAAAAAIEAGGGSAEARALDVADTAAGQAFVDEVAQQHGRLDILINNAGMNIREPTVDVSAAHYEQILAVNLRAPFALSQAAGRVMIAAGRGKIINVLSMATFLGLNKSAVYGMSKAALAQLTRTLASEWGAHNVQVNGIAPGFIRTELNQALWEDEGVLRWVVDNTPAGRLGKPKDVVGAALFLASPASDFVTGEVLAVDGGFLAGGRWPL